MSKLIIKNVRLSYPHLFEKIQYENREYYSANFILDKKANKEDIEKINIEIDKICAELSIDKKTIDNDYLCLKDGDLTKKEELKNCYYIVSRNHKHAPDVLDRNKQIITADSGKIYSGCYVNASISIWGYNQKEKRRKGISCLLNGVQFFADGDSFGSRKVNCFDLFEDLGGNTEQIEDWI
jgi:hypothetical protein